MTNSQSKKIGMGGHQLPNKGKTNDWCTPPEIIKALGTWESFDLDPCGCLGSNLKTAIKTNFYMPGILEGGEDGLTIPWYGRIWLNPPYGPETGKWLQRLADHGNGISLIFARTETKMFQKYVFDRASAVLFLAGRLHFYLPNGTRSMLNAGAPSCLIAYGIENVHFLANSLLKGKLVCL